MRTWKTRKAIQASLVEQYGVELTGFKEALRGIVEEYVLDILPSLKEECEIYGDTLDLDDEISTIFREWYGDISCVPAAYRIDEDEHWRHGTIHVYEIENTAKISDDKLQQYGLIADNDGPKIDLHIIDKYGKEVVTMDCDALMPYAFFGIYKKSRNMPLLSQAEEVGIPSNEEFVSEMENWRINHSANPASQKKGLVPIASNKEDEQAILRAVYEMGLIKEGDEI